MLVVGAIRLPLRESLDPRYKKKCPVSEVLVIHGREGQAYIMEPRTLCVLKLP